MFVRTKVSNIGKYSGKHLVCVTRIPGAMFASKPLIRCKSMVAHYGPEFQISFKKLEKL